MIPRFFALRAALFVALPVLAAFLVVTPAFAQDLIVDGTTMTLGGVQRFDNVRVINGGVIQVPPFDGTDRVNTGNLELIAQTVFVDASSRIDARGAGYGTAMCGDGAGPTPEAGGQGGCAVPDSGGGGAHFGRGGRGTIDCFICGDRDSCQFPEEFETDCGNSLNAAGTACTTNAGCRGGCVAGDGEPSVAGVAYRHSIYDVEFGAAGGDKGCRDSFDNSVMVAGPGGGRLVLVGLTAGGTGTVEIQGTVDAAGRRGCGTGNDSGGGGAGGSVLIVGDEVTVGATARVSAAGGLGGDTFAAATGQPDFQDCPAGAQNSGTCDDCGGGGGGGIINVLSLRSNLDFGADFDVGGADGGVCPICRGEAGGGAGELLLDGAYVGELCDGYDNDFDGTVDEGFGSQTCGLGSCAASIDACSSGAPVTCSPDTTIDATCTAAAADARPRIAVVLDTSSSMLLSLSGFPTFGDGSLERPGLDVDGNGQPDDSRLFLARNALGQVISAYPEIDFALARYHQDQGVNRSCQTAKWFECQNLIGTYDNPTDNTGPTICSVDTGPATSVEVREMSGGDECINYAGTCGSPRRGADILSGFGTPTRDLVRWLDGQETDFRPSALSGDVCEHTSGGDCEVRASGETPLGGSLEAVEDYVVPIRQVDGAADCRTYSVILVTDGAESCGGDPATQAARLFGTFGVETYVVAVSVLPEEEASLNALASAGSGGARPTATFVRAPADLVPALTAIIEGSIRTERCNSMDDDCDGRVDEGFNVGLACDDGERGLCRGTGSTVCASDELTTECQITDPGMPAGEEVCNGMDDDCDEAIDEMLTCTGDCTPSGAEICDGMDNDCNGLIDEVDPSIGTACGESEGTCEPGTLRCVGGSLECIGGVGPRDEVCNGLDDDCDGEGDDMAPCPGANLCIEASCRRPCDPLMEFACPLGFACLSPDGVDGAFCLPTACADCTAGERCVDDMCVDPCEGVTCEAGETCDGGDCLSCRDLGCSGGQLCIDAQCVDDPCDSITCGADEVCARGACQDACGVGSCAEGQRCGADGSCEADPCADTTCDAGRVCVDGSCREPACGACPGGTVCAEAVGCVDDACLGVRCPGGTECRVDPRGLALCDSTTPPMVDAGGPRFVSTGGGCAAGGQGRGGAGLLLLMGLFVWRRRNR
ncbi:MAG: MopE-related protein [Sandaracinaceae bacterium]